MSHIQRTNRRNSRFSSLSSDFAGREKHEDPVDQENRRHEELEPILDFVPPVHQLYE